LPTDRPRLPDCDADLRAYHAARIDLPASWMAEMRTRRATVHALIKRRLRAQGLPQPLRFRLQGSVAMSTVIKGGHYGAYDIDDGVYFAKRSLTGPKGGLMSALAARDLIRDAVDHGAFADPPEVRRNCVRVHYASGFHIDLPVYRVTRGTRGVEVTELAGSEWRVTDPAGVTAWFKAANDRSPGWGRDAQLRRIVQYVKMWVRSRSQPQGKILGGFGTTVLVVEEYRRWAGRDDRALHDTLVGIRDRLRGSLVIGHPVLEGAVVPSVGGDAPVRVFRDCLEHSLARLDALQRSATRAEALPLWDRFFNDDFFRGRPALKFI